MKPLDDNELDLESNVIHGDIAASLRRIKYWILGCGLITGAVIIAVPLWFLPHVVFSKERIVEQLKAHNEK